jgi:hypothetical protein
LLFAMIALFIIRIENFFDPCCLGQSKYLPYGASKSNLTQENTKYQS